VPLPAHLRQYDDIVPGAAARILDAVYQAPSHRQDKLVEAEITTAKVGQVVAILLAVVSVGASITFFAFDRIIAGSAFLGVPLVQLILSFFPMSRRSGGDEEPGPDNSPLSTHH